MISSLKKQLIILFFIQLAILLAFLLFNRSPDTQASQLLFSDIGDSPEAILGNITKLAIQENDQSVELTRTDAGWVRRDGQPADATKIDNALETLSRIKTSRAITTNANALARFELADDAPAKTITLTGAGNTSQTLLLGSSPAFKKSYARIADETSVYAMPINSFDFASDSDTWLDKDLLALTKIEGISHSDFRIAKNQDSWLIADTPDAKYANKEIANEKLEALLDTLNALRITKAFTEETLPGDSPRTQALSFSVRANGKSYRFEGFAIGEQFFIGRDDRNGLFQISQGSFETLATANAEQLLRDKPAVSTVDTDQGNIPSQGLNSKENSAEASSTSSDPTK